MVLVVYPSLHGNGNQCLYVSHLQRYEFFVQKATFLDQLLKPHHRSFFGLNKPINGAQRRRFISPRH